MMTLPQPPPAAGQAQPVELNRLPVGSEGACTPRASPLGPRAARGSRLTGACRLRVCQVGDPCIVQSARPGSASPSPWRAPSWSCRSSDAMLLAILEQRAAGRASSPEPEAARPRVALVGNPTPARRRCSTSSAACAPRPPTSRARRPTSAPAAPGSAGPTPRSSTCRASTGSISSCESRLVRDVLRGSGVFRRPTRRWWWSTPPTWRAISAWWAAARLRRADRGGAQHDRPGEPAGISTTSGSQRSWSARSCRWGAPHLGVEQLGGGRGGAHGAAALPHRRRRRPATATW
jgi:hypothetical protein